MKRVVVASLDWGLGHATRCIPVIRKLLEKGMEVFIAGSGESLLLLQREFPALRSFTLPGYAPEYPSGVSMVWKMATQLPRFARVIAEEHKVTEAIVKNERIDFVISDNRYGCWSSQVPCVFITHQSNILMPKRFGWMQGFVRRMNFRYMKKFTRCWIPDFADESLAGDLVFGSAGSLAVDYIGPLSRFSPPTRRETRFDVVAVFSGPEPQRTKLEEKVLPQLEASPLKYFVVRGIPSGTTKTETLADFLDSEELQNIIESSQIVIARSGYSTVMDLSVLGKKAIFIPTPGQTEQEYLAKRFSDQKIAFSVSQDQFELTSALKAAASFYGFPPKVLTGEALDDAMRWIS